MLRELARRTQERGTAELYLGVLADNAGARTLYDSCGFRAVHEYRYFSPPS